MKQNIQTEVPSSFISPSLLELSSSSCSGTSLVVTTFLKISRKSDRKSFKFLQMMEFDFIRRISKTRFQKFFKEKQTFVLKNLPKPLLIDF